MLQNLYGSYVAIVTPMLADGSVDFPAFGKLIDWHIEQGTHGIVSVGTTGESATLEVDEHIEVVEYSVKRAAGRIEIIAGTGANSTREAIELTRMAEQVKADACLLVVPYYNKPNQEGLYQHYKAIADAVPIAQVLYNVPGRTIVDMQNDTVARLAGIDNIIAIKDATGDIDRAKDLVDRLGDQIDILTGDDTTALEHMKVGGRGNISVTANVAPKLMSQMCEAAIAGDHALAESINDKLSGLNTKLFIESNPIPVKWAMHRLGLIEESLRLPMTVLASEFHQVVEEALTQAGIELP